MGDEKKGGQSGRLFRFCFRGCVLFELLDPDNVSSTLFLVDRCFRDEDKRKWFIRSTMDCELNPAEYKLWKSAWKPVSKTHDFEETMVHDQARQNIREYLVDIYAPKLGYKLDNSQPA